MAKLINILAASVGTGLVLGASIRLGEAIGSSAGKGKRQPTARPKPVPQDSDTQAILTDVVTRMDRQQADVETIRHQVARATRALDAVSEVAGTLRDDLHRQLNEELDHRLASVEEKLHLDLKAANKESVAAMTASIETGVGARISRLERDITGQSAAMAELRDCSLQSERSIQRLVAVLDRVINQSDAPKLAVVTNRGQDDASAESGARRPVLSR